MAKRISSTNPDAPRDVKISKELVSTLPRRTDELERVNAALKASQSELQMITDTMAAGVTRCSRDLRYLWVSRAYAAWLHRELHEIAGRPIIDVIGTQGYEAILPYMKQVLEGKRVEYESQVDFLGPGKRWISAVYEPTRDVTGVVDGWVAFVTDITERKLMEEKLRLSEEKFARVFAHNPAAVVITGLQSGRVVDVNESGLKMFGYSHDEVVGASAALLHWARPEDRLRFIQELRESGRYLMLEQTFLRRSGEPFVALISAETMTIAGEEVDVSTLLDITDRKQMEKQIAHLASFPKLNPTPIIEVDLEGNICYLNSAAETLLNPRSPLSLNPWMADFGTLVDSFRKDPNPVSRVIQIGDRWHHFVVNYVGEMERIRFYSHDATERKQAMEALRQSEERFRRYFELGLIGMAVTSPDKTWIEVNDQVCQMLGYERAELMQKTWSDITHPDDVEADVANFNRVVAGEVDAYSLDKRFIHKDGRVVFTTISARCLRRPDGQVDYFIVLLQDITERKRMEDELRESERRFRTMANAIPQLAWIAKSDGYIFWYNERWYEYTGTTPEQMEGWGWQSVHDPAILPEVLEQWRGSIATGRPFDMVFPLRGADGQFRPFLTRVMPLKDPSGNVIQWFGTNTDIAEARKAEEALKQAHEGLELRVQERTEELRRANETLLKEARERAKAEEQLHQVHKMEAIGTLAGGIAHDFNNMLAVILGNAELAIDEVDEGPRENIGNILKASMRSRELVKEILTFSRRNVGQGQVVEVVPLLKETHQLLRASLPSTISMKLNIRIKADTTIFAQPSEVQQVVVNLANNAAHAMLQKGGTLTVGLSTVTLSSDSITKDMRPGRYLKLTVKDTGTGITPEVQKRMFEPFFTTKDQGDGTGMGLSVVYGIVKAYKGMIEVESEVGRGSTFTVLLPQSDASLRIEVEAEEAEALSCSTNEHILFVDDEPTITATAKTMLEKMGYRVTAFTDASSALSAFTENPDSFDLIITDQTMPEVTGVALAKEALDLRKDMPIILCTGYSETASPVKAKEVGIREFVMKPITKKEMAQAIHRVLERAKESG